jgi:uncharacterized protein YrrD
MRRSLKDLVGYTIRASDGDIGKVDEFYFDDQSWTIRYVVVDTGKWLSGRKVLISPAAFDGPDWESRTFPVNLTKEQVQNSPSIDTDKPVSRQHESELHGYYGWPIYWGNGPVFGAFQASPVMIMEPASEEQAPPEEPDADAHLRSTAQTAGYHIEATDGEIGHVEDFVVDDETWAIRYMLVDTRNWLPGKHVLVSPRWCKRVSWEESKVFVDLTRDAIKSSPEFDPRKPVTLDYEGELHDYYGRPLD